ncbi:MAG: AAA family ATPase [bacterium]|nr:AAA family ATPase [bacterium]
MKLIFTVGLPTSGKSTLGAQLGSRTETRFLDIDELASLCFGPPEENPYATPEGADRDRKRMFGAYNVLATAVNFSIACGDSIIIAGTFSRLAYWDLFLPIIKQHPGIEVRVVWCRILHDEESIVTKRVERRGYRGGCRSLEHYLKDRERYVPPPQGIPQMIVDSSQPLEAYMDAVVEFVS